MCCVESTFVNENCGNPQQLRCAASLRHLLTVIAAVVAAGVVAACSSTGGAPRQSADGTVGGGGVDTPRAVVSMVTHGAPGDAFWDLVRKGAEDAARKDNIELRYSSDPQTPNQANLVQSAIDAHADGIAVTLPNAHAIGPVAKSAVDAGIPVVGLNAGMTDYKRYGLGGFFGQDENVAGELAGKRLKDDSAHKVTPLRKAAVKALKKASAIRVRWKSSMLTAWTSPQ